MASPFAGIAKDSPAAWAALASLSALFFLITAGTFTSLGVVLPDMVKALGWNWSSAGLGFTLLGLATGLASFAPAVVVRRLGVGWRFGWGCWFWVGCWVLLECWFGLECVLRCWIAWECRVWAGCRFRLECRCGAGCWPVVVRRLGVGWRCGLECVLWLGRFLVPECWFRVRCCLALE